MCVKKLKAINHSGPIKLLHKRSCDDGRWFYDNFQPNGVSLCTLDHPAFTTRVPYITGTRPTCRRPLHQCLLNEVGVHPGWIWQTISVHFKNTIVSLCKILGQISMIMSITEQLKIFSAILLRQIIFNRTILKFDRHFSTCAPERSVQF